jgi:plasmid stability protein
MKRQTIPEQRAVLVAAAVAAKPGRTRDELAAELGIPIPSARVALLIAARSGTVGLVRFAHGLVRWYPPEQVASVQAEADEISRQALAAKRQRWQEWKKAGKPPRVKLAPLDPGDEPIIRRHVDAGAPLPFKLQAARSVFDLGGAA